MPADIVFDEKQDGIHAIRIYRELRFGKLAHLVMTDERLYRTDHVLPEAAINPATGAPLAFAADCRELITPALDNGD